MPTERFTVRSADGVDISVQKAGAGPALLLIHGALLNGSLSWGAVLPKLAEHFTVYAMDRRGRAPSGDAKQYSIQNEADDIGAVVDAIGAPVTVLSHSYGALAALEALDRLKAVSHLILYEPPVTFQDTGVDTLANMDRALAAGDREQIVVTFLRDQIGVPADRLARMQSSPIWPIVLEISPTLPRESRTVNTHKACHRTARELEDSHNRAARQRNSRPAARRRVLRLRCDSGLPHGDSGRPGPRCDAGCAGFLRR